LAEGFGCKDVFSHLNLLHLKAFVALNRIEEAQLALDHVNQNVAEADQVVAPGHLPEVHGVYAGHGDITQEILLRLIL